MVEEMLVGKILTDEMISSGKKLIGILDDQKFIITSALWLLIPENEYWVLVLATPDLNTKGPKEAYKRIFPILEKNPDLHLSLQNILFLDITDMFISLMRTVIQTSNGISGIRFTKNTIEGVFIEDAYIYRMT